MNLMGNIAGTVSNMRLDLPNLPIGELEAGLGNLSQVLQVAQKVTEATQLREIEALDGVVTQFGNADSIRNAIDHIDTLLESTNGRLGNAIESIRDDLVRQLEEIDGDPSTTTVQQAGLDSSELNWNLAGIEATAGQASIFSRVSDLIHENQDQSLADSVNKLELGNLSEVAANVGATARESVESIQESAVVLQSAIGGLLGTQREVIEDIRANTDLPEDFDQAVALATTTDLDAYVSQMVREAEEDAGGLDIVASEGASPAPLVEGTSDNAGSPQMASGDELVLDDFDVVVAPPGAQTSAELDTYVSQIAREAESADEDYDVSVNKDTGADGAVDGYEDTGGQTDTEDDQFTPD